MRQCWRISLQTTSSVQIPLRYITSTETKHKSITTLVIVVPWSMNSLESLDFWRHLLLPVGVIGIFWFMLGSLRHQDIMIIFQRERLRGVRHELINCFGKNCNVSAGILGHPMKKLVVDVLILYVQKYNSNNNNNQTKKSTYLWQEHEAMVLESHPHWRGHQDRFVRISSSDWRHLAAIVQSNKNESDNKTNGTKKKLWAFAFKIAYENVEVLGLAMDVGEVGQKVLRLLCKNPTKKGMRFRTHQSIRVPEETGGRRRRPCLCRRRNSGPSFSQPSEGGTAAGANELGEQYNGGKGEAQWWREKSALLAGTLNRTIWSPVPV